MCSDESDIDGPIGTIDPDEDRVLIAGNVEHGTTTFRILTLLTSRFTSAGFAQSACRT
jgi:hypothetical protein